MAVIAFIFDVTIFDHVVEADQSRDTLKNKEQKLLRMKRQLEENVRKLESVKTKENALLDELDKIDFELQLINTQIQLMDIKKEQYLH